MTPRAITENIEVQVESLYQPQYSKPLEWEFFFAYRITIANLSGFSVKLLRRHWYITDGDGTVREVEGEGVVGEQPLIEPGQSYQYVSGCGFHAELGRMHGSYQMRREIDGYIFDVAIPAFEMVAPAKLN